MRRFALHRTLINGERHVFEGVEFTDGSVAVNWGDSQRPLIGTFPSAMSATAGKDVDLHWLDPEAQVHRLPDSDLAKFMWWSAHQMKRAYRDAAFCVARLFCRERGIDPDDAEREVVHGGWQPGVRD